MCASEVSDIEHSIWQSYKDSGVVVWGIAANETQTTVENYVEQLGITFPILLDVDGSVNAQYSQQSAFPTAAYPQDWIIGNDGVVIYQNNGFELSAMKTALDAALNE